ncbi:uncharacterized protein NDAI_0D00490 [Naumovozyma dairenensis CBS 421]|uniref:Uncharacterized protein n=1 Tax=Naumovozyma dairenensis (strain ATCC 10597 / BCRC 20456 / CBS 421 / NBRC 0211 / NRRL Y-12639) TaxID=1071378 RepID=G0W9A2_NAUDC|nr:hypothetical protein NDAI_0D00490 [Naumovozyma dairenensis CBS 421]CCD24363.1 hypothetical protein NDAI_0D00490 [Naumovozyma dairenensis CBS 421]
MSNSRPTTPLSTTSAGSGIAATRPTGIPTSSHYTISPRISSESKNVRPAYLNDPAETGSFSYQGVETVHNFDTMDANALIGGSQVRPSKITDKKHRHIHNQEDVLYHTNTVSAADTIVAASAASSATDDLSPSSSNRSQHTWHSFIHRPSREQERKRKQSINEEEDRINAVTAAEQEAVLETEEEEEEEEEGEGDETSSIISSSSSRASVQKLTTTTSMVTTRTKIKKPKKKTTIKPNTTHTIFSFSLPFGSTNLIPSTPITIIKNILVTENEKEKIKTKLKRNGSISSLEERMLFQDDYGIDNGHVRAVKETLRIDSLRSSIRQLKVAESNGTARTKDGYLLTRLSSIWNELEGDIVILGGYRGSILRDAHTGKRIWVPIKAGFNMITNDLLLGPNDEDEMNVEKNIIPDGMLTHVGPVDVSKRLIKKLEGNPKVHIEDFGYDWRVSLDISAIKLKDKLQELYDKQPEGNKKGTYLIAHSMGGLVAHKVLQDYTHLVRGIIYVAAPSQCPNILGPLRFGDEVMWNKTLLSKEANFFMRSSFYFLPLDGRCWIDSKTYKDYDLDYFDVNVWIKYGLSPLVSEKRLKLIESRKKNVNNNLRRKIQVMPFLARIKCDNKFVLGSVPIVKKVPYIKEEKSAFVETIDEREFRTSYATCVEYLSRTLRRAKAFLESLEYIPDKKYPPLVIVHGNTVPTVRGGKINGLVDLKNAHYDDFYYGPGDGVVYYKWLLPEQRGFPIESKISSDMGHVSLMADHKAMAKAFIDLVDAEKRDAS